MTTDKEKIEHLMARGYKPFRHVYDKKSGQFSYVKTTVNTVYLRSNFNKIINGGLEIRFLKGDSMYTYGLYYVNSGPMFIGKEPSININE